MIRPGLLQTRRSFLGQSSQLPPIGGDLRLACRVVGRRDGRGERHGLKQRLTGEGACS